jgi:hypothetical protein
MFRLTRQLKDAMNAAEYARHDRAFADSIRKWRGPDVAHLDDNALTEEVARQRRVAVSFGVVEPALRARFVMMAVALAPDFWRQDDLYHLLTARTGTPDIRFGDVCAVFRTAFGMTGRQDEIWWS